MYIDRENNIEVIYVRHDDGPENESTKATSCFEIYEKFKDEKDIIIVGLQTDYCIDATIKCGFEHGFNIIVPAYANTTVDNTFMTAEQSYKYYNEFMWNGRYAECISLDKTLNRMK
ncbi:MAG: isochorismatase family protein [Romboutsia sp.]